MANKTHSNRPVRFLFYAIALFVTVASGYQHTHSSKVDNTCTFSKVLDSAFAVEKTSEFSGNFGDCKLIDFQNEVYIVANLDSELSLKKINDANASFQRTNPIISSSWLDIIEDQGRLLCVTASFHEKSLRLYKIDPSSLNIELITTVHPYKEQLLIDPTILKVKDKYFITYTQIKGNINNADISKPNGHYEVVLLESKDLTNWTTITSIVSEDTNIEDGFLYYEAEKNALCFLYEEEVFDKHASALKLKKSTDSGANWDAPITLLSATADQEPATIFRCNQKNYLFYSSDLENAGASYYGAKGYVSSYERPNFKPEQLNVSLGLDDGILLYDVMSHNNKIHFLAQEMRQKEPNILVHYLSK